MKMLRKKRYLIPIAISGLVAVLLLILQLMAKQLVANFLEKKIPDHIDLTYDDMDINILTGTVGFENVGVALSNRDTTLVHSEIKSDFLTVSGLGYIQFFLRNTISADEIRIDTPDLKYYRHLKLPNKDSLQKGVVNLLKTIVVDKITINQGKFTMLDDKTDSVKVKVEKIGFSLYEAKIDPEIILRKIPVEYNDYDLKANDIVVDLGAFEKLEIVQLEFTKSTLLVDTIILASKYDKSTLSKKIRTERDFISLEVPEFRIDGIDFGFRSSRFYVTAESAGVSKPDLLIYRDKLVADDRTNKKLYASSLRELPIDLQIDSIQVITGSFNYEEQVSAQKAPGKLSFDDLNMTIANVGNGAKKSGATEVRAHALLMGRSPMELNWEFDVHNTKDAFLASGSLHDFKSSSSNSFLRPSLNIEAEGEIDRLYFTISGDAISSSGDLKMDYHDFKFDILGSDGKKINKFWTAIGNIFVNDGSRVDTDGFRHGKISVTRDPTKSFFNYLWLNIKEGLINTLTGDGKKE